MNFSVPFNRPGRSIARVGLITLLGDTLAAAGAGTPSPRLVIDFNPGWKLHVGDPAGAAVPGFDDGALKSVALPRAWNEDDAFRRDIVDHSTGVAWYRKRFTLTSEQLAGKIFIEFEGHRG